MNCSYRLHSSLLLQATKVACPFLVTSLLLPRTVLLPLCFLSLELTFKIRQVCQRILCTDIHSYWGKKNMQCA